MFSRDYDIMTLQGKIMRMLQLLTNGVKKIDRSQIELFKFFEDENNTNAIMRLIMTTIPFIKLNYEAGWFFETAKLVLCYDFDYVFIESVEVNKFLTRIKDKTEILEKKSVISLEPFKIDLETFLGENISQSSVKKLAKDLCLREMTPQELIHFYHRYDSIPRYERMLVSLNPVTISKDIPPVFLTVENTLTHVNKRGNACNPEFVRKIGYCCDYFEVRDKIKNIILVKK